MNREKALLLLKEANQINCGRWYEHSLNVAAVCERFAENMSLDSEYAFCIGVLHDIGRRFGVTGARHAYDGYTYLKELGYEDIGRYCLTHSYFVKNVRNTPAFWDLTKEEEVFMDAYLNKTQYNLYDKIIQLADALALPEGITTAERRLIDVYLRKGVDGNTIDNWKAFYKIQEEVESILGFSIYKLFPEVKNIDQFLIKDVLTY